LWRGEVLRKSLDTYKKKIDENHNILFSYNIAIEYLDFLVDENLLKFFDEAGHLLRFMTFELYIKVENKFFVGLIQSSLHGFDSFAVTKNNYYEGEKGVLKLFAFFDPEKTSYKKIKELAKKYGLEDFVDKEFGFTTNIQVYYKILDLNYI
jgi:hypothetical protein